MTQTIVIFGGSGFVGQKVCQEALKRDYHVISISRNGKPKSNSKWMNHAHMTWKSYDVLKDMSWQQTISQADFCLNLIGNFFETKNKTYDQLIIQTNEIISQWAKQKNIPYLFLSAKLGPPGYVISKKQAEKAALKRDKDVTIIRSGLVTGKDYPLKNLQGHLIQIGYHIPLLTLILKQVYPTSRDKLACVIIDCLSSAKGDSRIIDLTK